MLRTARDSLKLLSLVARGRRAITSTPSLLADKHVEKATDEVTLQPDITVENIRELTNIFRGDPDMAQAHVFSDNNLTAITIASSSPWWSARNSEGRVVGAVIGTRCGDSFFRSTGAYVDPAYRERGLMTQLYNHANADNLSVWPKSSFTYIVRDGVNFTKALYPEEQFEARYSVSMGVPPDNASDSFPTAGDGFRVVPFERGYLFDKLIYWDTQKVHMVPRDVFLKAFFTPGVVNGYVALDDKTDDVVGYGAIQLAINPKSHILGPVYGESDSIAAVLLHNLLKHYKPGNNVGAMIPTANTYMTEAMDSIKVTHKLGAEARFVGSTLPKKFHDHVYIISTCGTQFA